MSFMIVRSRVKNIDLSNFDTSNVTDMYSMFSDSSATTLDLSSFDTSRVTNMIFMFSNSAATTGYAKDQTTADCFNNKSITYIPDTLKFTVK